MEAAGRSRDLFKRCHGELWVLQQNPQNLVMLLESHPGKVVETRDPALSLGSSPAFATQYVWDLPCLVNDLTCLCLSSLVCKVRELCLPLRFAPGDWTDQRVRSTSWSQSAPRGTAVGLLCLWCSWAIMWLLGTAHCNTYQMCYSNLLTDLSLTPGFESINGRDLVLLLFSFSVAIIPPTFIVTVE